MSEVRYIKVVLNKQPRTEFALSPAAQKLLREKTGSSTKPVSRIDPNLVSVVEQLGSKAASGKGRNNRYCWLVVATVRNTKFEINETAKGGEFCSLEESYPDDNVSTVNMPPAAAAAGPAEAPAGTAL